MSEPMSTAAKSAFDPAFGGRSMRWYEWLVVLVLLALAAGVRAESAYRCDAFDGSVTYQADPCAETDIQHRIALAPPPSSITKPDYALPPGPRSPAFARSTRAEAPNAAMSYECRASDGEVFYRHGGCPHSLPAPSTGAAPARGGARGKAAASANRITVSARAVPRADACAEIHRAGAIGRNGHAHDEDVSTYERNLGRDPCK